MSFQPHQFSKKTTTCKYCSTVSLHFSFDFRKHKATLVDGEGFLHQCEEGRSPDISPTTCKSCGSKDVFWVRNHADYIDKYEMTESYGLPHNCPERRQFMLDWNEARRLDYAFEKAWLKSIPDGTICKRCKGTGRKSYMSNDKRLQAKFNTQSPIMVTKSCRWCKHIGTFTAKNKAFFLKELRKKYWPFKPGTHKWVKYDKGT